MWVYGVYDVACTDPAVRAAYAVAAAVDCCAVCLCGGLCLRGAGSGEGWIGLYCWELGI